MEAEISIAKVILSLLLVTGLIGLFALVLKWLGDKSILVRQMGGGKRVRLVESSVLDAKHRIFIVACDDNEHVLLSNGAQMMVLQSKKIRHPGEGRNPYPPSGEMVADEAEEKNAD